MKQGFEYLSTLGAYTLAHDLERVITRLNKENKRIVSMSVQHGILPLGTSVAYLLWEENDAVLSCQNTSV